VFIGKDDKAEEDKLDRFNEEELVGHLFDNVEFLINNEELMEQRDADKNKGI